jgi:hypothetical protein
MGRRSTQRRFPTIRALGAASIGLLCMASAHAQVYRCETGHGKIEFSDSPCAKGAVETQLNVRPNVLNTAESREAALKAENQRLTEQNLKLENDRLRDRLASQTTSPAPAVTGRTQADVQADLGNSPACQRARRDYEVSSSSIKPSREHLDALASSMRAACGLREPDRIVNRTTVNVDGPVRPLVPVRRPAER